MAEVFLASALDASQSREQREAAWIAYEAERWYEAVTMRGIALSSLDSPQRERVTQLIRERLVIPDRLPPRPKGYGGT